MIKRPIWLFSMDSDQFPAAPMTTGGLKAYFQRFGASADSAEIELVHFVNHPERIEDWKQHWLNNLRARAEAALLAGLKPVAGFSVYTWNAAEFLVLMRFVKESCPGVTIVAGGPHVQQARDYLFTDPVDLIVLGEGEKTFQDWLDRGDSEDWANIPGIAFRRDGVMISTQERPRFRNLDELPSALDVIDLCDSDGKPYDCIAYETSRGCPYKCAFCEWGTGAIGTKMVTFSVERIRDDWRRIVAAGIRNIWLTDSNFGALKDDLEKARALCELKRETGLPYTFATSWSKKHNPRVQEIVHMMHEHGLLPHYHLALQTLTPLALKLSNRQNMAANKYEPIAREMAKAGVPIACELIWGLPGDNLADFEHNLDRLFAVFPTLNIFGYTLLPGTEFYEKRDEYRIKTLPVAGYGKAKGEYVIGCHTFPVNEGLEGYYLITAHLLLNRGYMTPLTLRYLALTGSVPVSALMRAMLNALLDGFATELSDLNSGDRMRVYEDRARVYLTVLDDPERAFALMANSIRHWLEAHAATADILHQSARVLELDRAFCPRTGYGRHEQIDFDFDALALHESLKCMERPAPECFAPTRQTLTVWHPGGVGSVVKDPDGGVWIHGEMDDAVAATPVRLVEALA